MGLVASPTELDRVVESPADRQRHRGGVCTTVEAGVRRPLEQRAGGLDRRRRLGDLDQHDGQRGAQRIDERWVVDEANVSFATATASSSRPSNKPEGDRPGVGDVDALSIGARLCG